MRRIKKMRVLSQFRSDRRGIVYTVVAVLAILFVADIMYLVLAVSSASFFDAFEPYVADSIQEANLLSTLRNVGPITIIIINVGLILVLVVSAWKRGTNEVEALQV